MPLPDGDGALGATGGRGAALRFADGAGAVVFRLGAGFGFGAGFGASATIGALSPRPEGRGPVQ